MPPNEACGGPLARLPVPDFTGQALVEVEQCGAACGDTTHPQMGPVVQQVDVLPQAQVSATSEGPARGGPTSPLECGVSVFGSQFGPLGQGVQIRITDAQNNLLLPWQTATVDGALGGFVFDTGPSFTYTGPAKVMAWPMTVGQPVTIDVNLCGGSTAGQISAPTGLAQTSSATPGAGQTQAPAGGGAAPSGGGGLAPRVHAAE
jgi:hypothetical protein